jgi:flavin-dependent dehydrogenase
VEDSDVLRHLLKVESEAAALAGEAAQEAEKRIASAEKQNRLKYDEAYTKEAAALEEKYRADIEGVKKAYQKELDDFAQSLGNMKTDADGFSALLEQLLFQNK